MLVVDLNKASEPVWREYAPGVEIKFKPLKRGDLTRIKSESGGNTDAFYRALFRHIVLDWKGFVAPDGSVVPRSDEAVDVVFSGMLDLSEWAETTARNLMESVAAERAVALGK